MCRLGMIYFCIKSCVYPVCCHHNDRERSLCLQTNTAMTNACFSCKHELVCKLVPYGAKTQYLSSVVFLGIQFCSKQSDCLIKYPGGMFRLNMVCSVLVKFTSLTSLTALEFSFCLVCLAEFLQKQQY